MNRHEQVFARRVFELGKTVLVVGCGTGGACAVLSSIGLDVIGLEPNRQAYEIAREKMALLGRPNAVIRGLAESIPLPEGTFDLVICHSVLEHVEDPERSLHEMVRVLRPLGMLILSLNDACSPIEMHYKLPIPPRPFPRWFAALWLRLLGRDTTTIWSVNRLTAGEVQSMIKRTLGVYHLFRTFPMRRKPGPFPHLGARLAHWIDVFWRRVFGVFPTQEYFIFKGG